MLGSTVLGSVVSLIFEQFMQKEFDGCRGVKPALSPIPNTPMPFCA